MNHDIELQHRLADAFAAHEAAAVKGRAASVVLQGAGVPGWLDHEAAGKVAAALFDLHGVTDDGAPLFVLRPIPHAARETTAPTGPTCAAGGSGPSAHQAKYGDVLAIANRAFDNDVQKHRFLVTAVRSLGYRDTTLQNLFSRLRTLTPAELARVAEKLETYEAAHSFAAARAGGR